MKAIRGSFWPAAALLLLPALGGVPAHAQLAREVDPDWAREKQALIDFGKQFASSTELYQALRESAENPEAPPSWRTLDEVPDWSGLWNRQGSPTQYDPDQGRGFVPTAALRGVYAEMMQEAIDNAEEGRIFDETSVCGVPRGFPGFLRNPLPWEFAVTPHQTWIMTEAQNEVRRVYTDGRDHIPAEMAYPSEDGDTIGFWDGDRLVTHTQYVKAGWLGRMQPYLSDQLEGVEIWQKVDEETIRADVWLFDSEALAEPWFTRQTYRRQRQPFEGFPIRIHFWECDNPNNAVTRTEDGGSTFTDFSFTDVDDQ